MKSLAYNGFYGTTRYWRNTQQAEIDFIEMNENELAAYEIKYNPTAKAKFSKSFTEKYHPAKTIGIHKENFWEYL